MEGGDIRKISLIHEVDSSFDVTNYCVICKKSEMKSRKLTSTESGRDTLNKVNTFVIYLIMPRNKL